MFRPLAAADYEVAFYLKHINQQRDPPASLVKNRRYAQLKRLMAQGSFFGDDALRSRDPVLFHQLVGQYQPTVVPAKTGRLSTDILDQGVNYDEIDNDALGLDDDNAAEADRDALESHFNQLD
ncbi:hypothetical protein WJX73_005341 [Symbiochloris irregularis]|uniref:CCD97-like C-terminal domain-containing protein n=1 Tax=Symbiochloris irregularis TaxID=706552 RepID=A0AAW1P246_9CHLO